LEVLEDRTLPSGPDWLGYAHDPQHTAISPVPSQSLDVIRWQTPVDLAPPQSGTIGIHYGSPLVTPMNTVIVPVKTGATSGFRVEAHSGIDGSLKWVLPTDYILPPYGWIPSYSPTLTPQGRLYFPGAGGTVYYTDTPDANGATITGQLAFYGIANYTHSLDSTVKINTPLTSDAAGNIYFGFQVTGANALNLQSGLARLGADGTGTWVAASVASGDANMTKVLHTCAPALSNDGSTVYVAVSNGNGTANTGNVGYLLALDSTTLATKAKVFLTDPRSTSNAASLSQLSTASPTVGPDGDVYFGVLDNPFDRHDRGWMLHFSGDLKQTKIPGGFGWDDTASIVPASMVPSYTGSSSYLLMVKYNDYAEFPGGTGINKIAIIDPNASQPDFITGTPVMKDVLTIAGVTPDPDFPDHPGAVREWCINTAAVDPFTKSILANSEDGSLYRWDLTTNSFTESIHLAPATSEAYTPTVVGPNGAVYAINDAVLFAVQGPAGPVILAQNPVTTNAPVSDLRVTFSREIDLATFTLSQIPSFTGPAGPVHVTGITPVGGSGNKQFDISFTPQTALGNYTIVIGPDVRDVDGNAMDTNDNGITGENPGDQYIGHFTVVGPKIVASTPNKNLFGPVSSIRVTFNEPMNPATFTPDKVFDFFGPNGQIPVTAVTPVSGFNDTTFDLSFDPQVTTGIYHMLIGPNIRDFAGHQMDQNGNFIEGEIPGDLYQAQFGILGPRIIAATPSSPVDGPVYSLRVTFNEPIDYSTFTPDKIPSFTGPNGDIAVAAVVPVSSSNFTQFDILFSPQVIAGPYHMVIGPNILDMFGNAMDQNQNFITGEIPGDQFNAQFLIRGPRITTNTPPGDVFAGLDHVRVTFNTSMDPNTFTLDQVSFTGPSGPINVTDISAVPFTNNTQFDISFDPANDLGAYTMVIGPNILDTFGNAMDQNQNGITGEIPGDQFVLKFNVVPTTVGPDGFGHTATVTPFQNLEILGQLGTFTVIPVGTDLSVPVDLGTNTFTFYGVTYTGANKLFVSTNGLITFGSANTSHNNSNLTMSPMQPAIAALWNDWKASGSPMVLGKFDAYDDNGVPHELILEWNQVTHVGNTGTLTFQVVLALNTGAAEGDIVVNYASLQSGDVWAEGNNSTVGIKAVGAQGLNRLLITSSGFSPFVGTDQAILFTKPASSGVHDLVAAFSLPDSGGNGGGTLRPLADGNSKTRSLPDTSALPTGMTVDGFFASARLADSHTAPSSSQEGTTVTLGDLWEDPLAIQLG
jgi:hypothetical protein